MGLTSRIYRGVLLTTLALALASCAPNAVDTPAITEPEKIEDSAANPVDVINVTYVQPVDCTGLLPDSEVAALAADGVELVRGPGSTSSEPIFVEGQTPEELVGGLSCLFSVPVEDDEEEESSVYIILSAAPMEAALRPGVISDLLDQQLNTGNAADGALTYWIWGDDVIVPALHNALYEDSWYSALLQPGGRSAYDQGVALVQSMRSHTTK